MSWELNGRAIEHCNCDAVCPCFTSALAQPGDYDRCVGMIAVHVDEATGDAADVVGMTAAMLINAPPQMADGDWTVGVVVDEGTSDAQAEFLAGLLTGASGGPMEAFGPLIGTNLGYERAKIEFMSEGGKHRLVAPGSIDFASEDTVHEGADAPVQLVGAALPFGPPVTISPAVTSRLTTFGFDVDNSGRHGTSSAITWAG